MNSDRIPDRDVNDEDSDDNASTVSELSDLSGLSGDVASWRPDAGTLKYRELEIRFIIICLLCRRYTCTTVYIRNLFRNLTLQDECYLLQYSGM